MTNNAIITELAILSKKEGKEGGIAINRLEVEMRPIVAAIVAKTYPMWGRYMQPEDAKSAASLGWLEALYKFNPGLGVNFITVAWKEMLGSISHATEKEGGHISGGVPQAIRRLCTKIAKENGCSIGSPRWISSIENGGYPAEQVADLLQAAARWGRVELDASVSDDEGNEMSRGATIASKELTPEEAVVGCCDEQALLAADGLTKLTEKERNVLLLRIAEQESFVEIGGLLGIEPATAQQTFKRAITKLKRFCGVNDDPGKSA